LPVPERSKPHPSLLERFFDEIAKENNPGADVAGVAGALGVDPSHLCRAVKVATGRTPRDYIRQAKLSRGRELLFTSSVTQAALGSGFAKVSTFIALFRKCYGETPGTLKRRISFAGMSQKHFQDRA
jgi:AraC-like DNA-binding protein